MEIIVEIGTPEQQTLIKKELEVIRLIHGHINAPKKICALIVPENFDKKINELQGTTNYVSLRANHRAVAKIITNQNGSYLIFSPLLYTEMCDNITRLQYYLHEFLHAINREDFLPFKQKELSASNRAYLEHLYILFDEYDVDRKSLNIIDGVLPQLKSKVMRYNSRYVKEMIKPIINNDSHYNAVCSEITKFRIHGNVNTFLDNITPYYDEVTKILIHSYSTIDHYPKFKRLLPFLKKSKFVNRELDNLINYYRKKFETKDPDLLDGIPVMSDFMGTFGIKFSDIPNGLYCHVNNIND